MLISQVVQFNIQETSTEIIIMYFVYEIHHMQRAARTVYSNIVEMFVVVENQIDIVSILHSILVRNTVLEEFPCEI